MDTTKIATKNIVATTRTTPKLKTFSKALEAAGLENTLEGKGPYTVFAPTDEAFRALPKNELDRLFDAKNKNELGALLKRHILSGKTTSSVAKTMEVKTLGGSTRHLKVDSRGVALDDSRITQADITCSNGVIHAIDKLSLKSR